MSLVRLTGPDGNPNIDSRMALTLFRLGIWILMAVLVVWVLRDAVLADFADHLSNRLLNQVGLVGLATLFLGVIAVIWEKLSAGPKKHRCKVCGKPVSAGEYYCREHLREIVDRARGH